MNPNQPDDENNPNNKPCRVLHNPCAPRAKKPRQAMPNPHNRATAEEPTPTNNLTPNDDDNPAPNNNDEPTLTKAANDPDQNPT